MTEASDAITENLTDFCKMTAKVRSDIARIADVADPDGVLKQGWNNAYTNKKYSLRKGTITFHIEVDVHGRKTWVEVLLKESGKEGERLPYFACDASRRDEPPREVNSLGDFANVRPELYDELARIALAEPWSFTGEGNELLRFYLNGTFLRIVDEGKLGRASDEEGEMCVWCTGLVNAHYEDIFCFCTPNPYKDARQKWVVNSFCTSGSTHAGQRLRRAFGMTPPQRANYFECIADTIYDGNLDLVVNYGHVMRRIHRIGIPALRVLLASSKDAIEIVERASLADSSKREAILKELNDIVAADTALQQSLFNAIDLAVKRARARARYMYTSALPAWNPKGRGQFAFCLPLCLVVEERVDTVLVACLAKGAREPFYEGKTIFDLKMAYKNVRTIQRTDGMTGWVSSALDSDGEEQRASAFAALSHTGAVAGAEGGVPATTPVFQNVVLPSPRARLVPGSDAFPQLMVCDGDTIGLVRRPQEVLPRIQLPESKEFGYASQIHGRFYMKDGSWFYTHEGANWSRITRSNGSVVMLEAKGQSAEIACGDSLSFTGSPEYRFER